MADQKVVEELTQCPICFNTLNRPKYLPCLHTFCEGCLQQYIFSNVEGITKADGFNCPVCRHFVAMSLEGGKSVENLAKDFPHNHMVMTLIDQSAAKQGKLQCQPCKQKSKSESATSWCAECKASLCEQCSEFHTSLPALQSHQLTPISEVQINPNVLSAAHELCETHPDKKLEMYCLDHQVACCATCTMVAHRRCESVDTLTNVAQSAKQSAASNALQTKLDQEIESMKSMEQESNTIESEIDESCAKMQDTVLDYQAQINEHVENLAQSAMDNISDAQTVLQSSITKQADICTERRKVLENLKRMFDASLNNSSEIQFFLESKKIEKKWLELCEDKVPPNAISSVPMQFNISRALEVAMQCKSFGQIRKPAAPATFEQQDKCSMPNPTGQSASPFTMRKFQSAEKQAAYAPPHKQHFSQEKRQNEVILNLAKTVDVDKGNSSVTSCAWLPDGRLVIVDYKQKRVIDGQLRILSSDASAAVEKIVTIRGKPWDIAVLSDSYIAVSVPAVSAVYVIDTRTFTIVENLKFNARFYGLAVKEKLKTNNLTQTNKEDCKLYATSRGKIYLINLMGWELKQLSVSRRNVQYVATDAKGRIYAVSGDSVICVDEATGSPIFCFTDPCLTNATGIATGQDGDVFACGLDSGSLVRIDKSGHKLSVYSLGVKVSYLAFCQNFKRACIVSGGQDDKNEGKIYDVKVV